MTKLELRSVMRGLLPERQLTGCVMQDAAQYREYAEQCRELAKRMSGENRQTLLAIADAWEKCAREVEGEPESGKADGKGEVSEPR